MLKFLTNELLKVHAQMEQLCNMFKAEFGESLQSEKLVIKVTKCNNKKCFYCPHGPYWFRAFFNKTKKRFMFKYIGASIKKSMLKKHELTNWARYKFYDDEIKRLKKEKKLILKEIKKLRK